MYILLNIQVPKMLPSYVEKAYIEKLLEALRSKKSHKSTIRRDIHYSLTLPYIPDSVEVN